MDDNEKCSLAMSQGTNIWNQGSLDLQDLLLLIICFLLMQILDIENMK